MGVSPRAPRDRSRAVGLLGVPFDGASSFLRGAAEGPAALRAALRSTSTNSTAESGEDIATRETLVDLGDVVAGAMPEALENIEGAARAAAREHDRLVFVGGDHAITFPLLAGLVDRWGPLSVLHFDAHPDLYDVLDGDRYSHACPFARALEAGLVGRLLQVGIRAWNRHQQEQIERFGVEVVTMGDFRPDLVVELSGPAYLSFDLDALDPAFAPGVSHHEPGGLTTREALGVIQRARLDLVAADIVELNPRRDLQGVTAMTAAKILKEVVVRLRDSSGAAGG